MMKRIVAIVALGLLVGAGFWGYSYVRSRGDAPKYRLTRIDRGDGKPTPVMVTTGITDGTATEILQSELTEGQEVIVGLTGSGATTPQPPSGTSPRLRL